MWWKVGLVLVMCWGLTSSEEHHNSSSRTSMFKAPLDFGFVPSVVYETHAYYEPGPIGVLFHMVHAFLYVVQPNPFPKGEMHTGLETLKSSPHSCSCIRFTWKTSIYTYRSVLQTFRQINIASACFSQYQMEVLGISYGKPFNTYFLKLVSLVTFYCNESLLQCYYTNKY